MNFDCLYLLSFVFFFICVISLGCAVSNSLRNKSIFKMFSQDNIRININKFLNYETYLQKRDYNPYEKYEIWRFYVPS